MYVAVKGGEKAIRNAHKLTAKRRRGDTSVPALTSGANRRTAVTRGGAGDGRRFALR
jgi:alpha-D-ribose 1-methylphosphonate 5-triphosphate synthase subunit PhnI